MSCLSTITSKSQQESGHRRRCCQWRSFRPMLLCYLILLGSAIFRTAAAVPADDAIRGWTYVACVVFHNNFNLDFTSDLTRQECQYLCSDLDYTFARVSSSGCSCPTEPLFSPSDDVNCNSQGSVDIQGNEFYLLYQMTPNSIPISPAVQSTIIPSMQTPSYSTTTEFSLSSSFINTLPEDVTTVSVAQLTSDFASNTIDSVSSSLETWGTTSVSNAFIITDTASPTLPSPMIFTSRADLASSSLASSPASEPNTTTQAAVASQISPTSSPNSSNRSADAGASISIDTTPVTTLHHSPLSTQLPPPPLAAVTTITNVFRQSVSVGRTVTRTFSLDKDRDVRITRGAYTQLAAMITRPLNLDVTAAVAAIAAVVTAKPVVYGLEINHGLRPTGGITFTHLNSREKDDATDEVTLTTCAELESDLKPQFKLPWRAVRRALKYHGEDGYRDANGPSTTRPQACKVVSTTAASAPPTLVEHGRAAQMKDNGQQNEKYKRCAPAEVEPKSEGGSRRQRMGHEGVSELSSPPSVAILSGLAESDNGSIEKQHRNDGSQRGQETRGIESYAVIMRGGSVKTKLLEIWTVGTGARIACWAAAFMYMYM